MRTNFGSAILPFLVALLLAAVYAAAGERAVIGAVGAVAGLYLVGFVWMRSDIALVLSFPLLICMPFFLGVSRSPKIFLDQIFILLLLGVVSLKVLLKKDVIHLHLFHLLWPVMCVTMMGLTLFYQSSGVVAMRTFFETFGLGLPLCLCLLSAQLATHKTVVNIAKTLALTILFISLAGIAEVVARYNPIMEYTVRHYSDEYTYMSPELTDATGGQYRPYVVYSNPSEAGTVAALCLPFIAALAATDRRWRTFAFLVLALGVAFIVVNATRGVWVGVGATAFLFVPRVRRYVMMLMPLWLILGALAVVFMADTNFWERVSSFRNFEIRLWYWEQALLYYEGNWLLGVGIGNFSHDFTALGPLSAIPVDYLADVQNISTVDNIFLMILVEQGIIGLLGFVFLGVFLFRNLYASHKALLAAGREADALYVRAALATFSIYLICGCLADVHLFTKATKLIFMLIGVGWGMGLYKEREAR